MTYRIRREAFSDVDRASYNDVIVRFVDGKLYPAVCVKVQGSMFVRAPEDVQRAPADVCHNAYEAVRADWWTLIAIDLAGEYLKDAFAGSRPHVRADGRSEGWLLVCGIGTPDEWTETQLAAWKVFEAAVEESIKDAEKLWHEAVRKETRR